MFSTNVNTNVENRGNVASLNQRLIKVTEMDGVMEKRTRYIDVSTVKSFWERVYDDINEEELENVVITFYGDRIVEVKGTLEDIYEKIKNAERVWG